jgi:hypothetical protein
MMATLPVGDYLTVVAEYAGREEGVRGNEGGKGAGSSSGRTRDCTIGSSGCSDACTIGSNGCSADYALCSIGVVPHLIERKRMDDLGGSIGKEHAV